MPQHPREVTIFLSGTFAFIHHLLNGVLVSSPVVVCLPRESPLPRALRAHITWLFLVHHQFDGVTSGGWWLGTNLAMLSSPTPLPSVRRLTHLLDPLLPGRPYVGPPPVPLSNPSVRWVHGICDPGGLWPIYQPDSKVICPFVKTKGWVSRPLSTTEICLCLDLPTALVSSFTGVAPNELPFLWYAPPKLLWAFAKEVALGTWPEVTSKSHYAVKVDPGWKFPEDGCASNLVKPRNPVGSSHVVILERADELLVGEGTPELVDKVGEVINDQDRGRQRAAKDDDACIPLWLWDDPFWEHYTTTQQGKMRSFRWRGREISTLDRLREFLLRVWRRRVFRSYARHMRLMHGHSWWLVKSPDLAAGRDCIIRTTLADFWEWHGGSRLFFWRWPGESKLWARDGLPIYTNGSSPTFCRPQPNESDVNMREKVKQKLAKFLNRSYIETGPITSLISYFTVPKGEDDVRLVFDGTKSGLNAIIWSPTFTLPTVDTLLSIVEPGSFQCDIDIGEQFYNFMLDPNVQPYAGVDLTPYLGRLPNGGLRWGRWTRCVMGLRSSPHGCVLMHSLGEEITRGDPVDKSNPFFFDSIRLNLPGMSTYNPALPRVSKLSSLTNRLAADMITYVDDNRPVAPSARACRQLARRIASRLCYLGEQDAARKRSAPSLRAGAWAGAVVHTDGSQVCVQTTVEKWGKAQLIIQELTHLLQTREQLPFKLLEQHRGFLVYLGRTYPSMVPYLKGLHLTIDSWRPNRGMDGWRDDSVQQVQSALGIPPSGVCTAPDLVTPVPRLSADLEALGKLLSPMNPPRRILRIASRAKVYTALYGFADASGSWFGSCFTSPDGIHYKYGLWGDYLAGYSSNFKELFNVTTALEDEVGRMSFTQLTQLTTALELEASQSPSLPHSPVEIFIFTDNAVAESAFFKGTSSNHTLFELVLRLRKLELHSGIRLQVVHVAGKRMLAQGTDGLSRGSLFEGGLHQGDLLSFVPLHLSALDRSSGILSWLRAWIPSNLTLKTLTPFEWYFTGHGVVNGSGNSDGVWLPGTLPRSQTTVFIWAPAPAAADAAIEQLAYSRHKRPWLWHVFLCPRLMTNLWRKRLLKIADVTFSLPVGVREKVWSANMFEPLTVGLLFPFLPHPPWLCRYTPTFLELEGQLRAVWQNPQGAEWPLLRQLWNGPGGLLRDMPKGVVWGLLHSSPTGSLPHLHPC
jgi:hypothetical protein